MNKRLSIAQADLMTLLNRRMLILFALLFFIYAMANMGVSFLIIPLIFLFRPFHYEETGASLLLFAPVTKTQVVQGRYLFGLLLLLFLLAMNSIISILLYYTQSSIVMITTSSLLILVVLYFYAMSIFLPIFFRFGYQKSMKAVYGFILLIALLAAISQKAQVNKILQQISDSPFFLPLGLVLLLFSIISLYLSQKKSIQFLYQKDL